MLVPKKPFRIWEIVRLQFGWIFWIPVPGNLWKKCFELFLLQDCVSLNGFIHGVLPSSPKQPVVSRRRLFYPGTFCCVLCTLKIFEIFILRLKALRWKWGSLSSSSSWTDRAPTPRRFSEMDRCAATISALICKDVTARPFVEHVIQKVKLKLECLVALCRVLLHPQLIGKILGEKKMGGGGSCHGQPDGQTTSQSDR